MMPPLLYERDDTRRLIVVTVQGEFAASDMIAAIRRQRAEGTWSYGMLYDLRGMSGQPAIADLRLILDEAVTSRPNERPRGPIALLAIDPKVYAIGCQYAALVGSKFRIEVFRDKDEAHRWLARELRDETE